VIGEITSEAQMVQAIAQLEKQMRDAAKNFEFERAAGIRDRVRALKQRDLGAIFSSARSDSPVSTPAAENVAAANSESAGNRVAENAGADGSVATAAAGGAKQSPSPKPKMPSKVRKRSAKM
jgi:hypothetical protein